MRIYVISAINSRLIRFYSSSLLLIYEGSDEASSHATLKMIDFASSCFPQAPDHNTTSHVNTSHVNTSHVNSEDTSGADGGYVFGLESLLRILNDMLIHEQARCDARLGVVEL